jgi:hypothetical protein
VMFAELIARFYQRYRLQNVDFYAVRIATAFHDSGRQANGVDLWESDSSDHCLRYVDRRRHNAGGAEYSHYVASLIDKRPTSDVSQRIVYDADVLEIMRPCCGHGGLRGFRQGCLHFAGPGDSLAVVIPDADRIRKQLIHEAWKWIQETEDLKKKLFSSSIYMYDLLETLNHKKHKYPMLSALLE